MSRIPSEFSKYTYPVKEETVESVYGKIPFIPERYKVVGFRPIVDGDVLIFLSTGPNPTPIRAYGHGGQSSYSPRLILEERKKVKRKVRTLKETGKSGVPVPGQYYGYDEDILYCSEGDVMRCDYPIFECVVTEVEEYLD